MVYIPALQSGRDPDVLYLGNASGISAYADQQTDAANAFLLQLGNVTSTLVPPNINPEFPVGPSAPAISLPTPPIIQTIVWTAPDAPDVFVGELTIDDILPETFDEDPPELVFGTAPTFNVLPPTEPGIDTSYVMPELEFTLPSAPSLLSLNIVTFDGINLPTIDYTVPELTLEAPTIREYIPGAQYTSSLLTALKTHLESTLTGGGTGIGPDVENAIWDRGREREARSAADAIRALEQMEAMGFAYPPGVYLDARLKIVTELDYVDRGHSREVMIKAAELEQENVRTALTTTTQLEGQLINYSNQVEQRLFESSKYATEAGIAVYNARVQAYLAYVDAYKAKVEIYKAQIQAEGMKVEVYKAQIEAETAKTQINRALVDMYKTQIDAALSNVEIFKARIGAIQAKAEIEKNKIEIFGEQVKAYGTQVQAYTAGIEGFRATIQAEASKQDAFRSQVDAYSARVGAGVKVIEARIAAFRGNLDANISRWEGYKAAYQAEAAKASAYATNNSSLTEGYKAQVAGLSSYYDNLTKQWQVGIDQAQRVSEIGVSAAKANGELYMSVRSLALDAAKVGATVSAQLGAAALNAINWSTSYSNSNSWGISNSYSNASSQSYSEGISTNYNYSASL